MACDILFFSLFRTDNPYSSISLSMAKEIARTNRVLYVNHPYSWKDLIKGLLQRDTIMHKRLPGLLWGRVQYETLPQIPANFIGVVPPPTLPINWLPPGALYQFLQGWNNRIVLRAISKALRDHDWQKYAYINCYNPFYAGSLPENLGAAVQIYHCIDDITQDAYTDKHGTNLEIAAIRKADLTFVTSSNLKKLKSAYSNRIVLYYNAADVTLFKKVWQERFPKPMELSGKTGKVIGFVGNLDALRIDYALLKQIALAYPQHTMLLIGPMNSSEPAQIGLDRLPNVVWTGSRPLESLPAYLQYMDCVLIPFLCNTLTASIYPLKINEYLAAGKAVVSTAFSEDIKGFADYIYLAQDSDDFIQKIAIALDENPANEVQRRSRLAETNSWAARIEQLWAEIDKVTLPARQKVTL
jgi:glycosyltransferase involved in cell wall biosynthesis